MPSYTFYYPRSTISLVEHVSATDSPLALTVAERLQAPISVSMVRSSRLTVVHDLPRPPICPYWRNMYGLEPSQILVLPLTKPFAYRMTRLPINTLSQSHPSSCILSLQRNSNLNHTNFPNPRFRQLLAFPLLHPALLLFFHNIIHNTYTPRPQPRHTIILSLKI